GPASPNGCNGWYTTTVTTSWSVSDPNSGISTSSGCGSTTTTSDTTGVTLTCSATNSAGLSSSASVSYKIDKSPPVITPTVTPASPDGTNGWYTSDVTVSWSTTDPPSGVSTSSGCGSTPTTTHTTGATLTHSHTNRD